MLTVPPPDSGHLIHSPSVTCLSDHGDAAATRGAAGKGDLGDADVGCGGLTVASTHTLGNSSRYTPGQLSGSGWIRRGEDRGRGRTSANDVGFTQGAVCGSGHPSGPVGPRLHPRSESLAHWMEFGIIGGERHFGLELTKPPETVAVERFRHVEKSAFRHNRRQERQKI